MPRNAKLPAPAGYSETPLVKKLGIKPNARMLWANAPEQFARLLGPLPIGVEHVGSAGKGLDFAILFVADRKRFESQFKKFAARIAPSGMLWVSWPKKTSGVATDLDENVIRDFGLKSGLVDIKVCAVDEIWSGLKFVIPLKDRPTKKS